MKFLLQALLLIASLIYEFIISNAQSAIIRPSVDRLDVAYHTLQKIHATQPAGLERDCYTNLCNFATVSKYFPNLADATEYWALLSCVKYGFTCGAKSRCFGWLSWQPCSARCGSGQQTRYRYCYVTPYWGDRRHGQIAQAHNCTHDSELECMEDPGKPDTWTKWGLWSSCNLPCGMDGKVHRTRTCLPTRDPQYCVGSARELRGCIDLPACPLHGVWTDWAHWTSCKVMTCGNGFHFRLRTCSNPRADGNGIRCQGVGMLQEKCSGKPCNYEDMPPMAHLSEKSYIQYPPHQPTSYLHLVLRFRPITARGTILRYTGIPVEYAKPKVPSNIYIINNPAKNETKVSEEFVRVYMENDHVMVSLSVNGSDLVVMETGKVKVSQWNVVRLLIVSNLVSVRTNDGENMEEVLRDSPLAAARSESNATWYQHMIDQIENSLPESIAASLFGKTRAILAKLKGRITVGKDLDKGESFRGYLAVLRVNFVSFSFIQPAQSEVKLPTDPMTTSGVDVFRHRDVSMGHEEAVLPHFDGTHRVYIPFILKWWTDSFEPPKHDVQSTKADDIIAEDASTLEIVFKPEIKDAIILWNRGRTDIACQWKLTIEDGVQVKLIMATHGGKIHITESDRNIKFRHWNTVVIQFRRVGEMMLQSNNGTIHSTKIPPVTEDTVPGPVLIIGGARHFQHDNSTPSTASQRHVQSFLGFVYSVKQNGVEFSMADKDLLNSKNMPTSLFTSKPAATKFWFFKPTYENKPDGKSSDRILSCEVPFSSDVTIAPTISWLKDDLPVQDNALFQVTTKKQQKFIRSNLFLKPSPDGSKELSGVYSCVVKSDDVHWLLVNHVVAVIHRDIISPSLFSVDNLLLSVEQSLEVSKSQAVFIVLGSVSGACVVIMVTCWLVRRCTKGKKQRGRKTRPSGGAAGTEKDKLVAKNGEDSPLIDQPTTSRHSHRKRRKGLLKRHKVIEPRAGPRDEAEYLLPSDDAVDEVDLYDVTAM
ncbi:unnamed protein product [Clavelina lepadiformis]|uniref:Ig-like domain-containing protein n=1 Tax=Clavelina lepadiformis TaxID=159417 RepID=A0ABP0G2B0_CLALP